MTTPAADDKSADLRAAEQRHATSPVEIFSIGKELLIGRIQDTNSFWIAQQITDLGGTM